MGAPLYCECVISISARPLGSGSYSTLLALTGLMMRSTTASVDIKFADSRWSSTNLCKNAMDTPSHETASSFVGLMSHSAVCASSVLSTFTSSAVVRSMRASRVSSSPWSLSALNTRRNSSCAFCGLYVSAQSFPSWWPKSSTSAPGVSRACQRCSNSISIAIA